MRLAIGEAKRLSSEWETAILQDDSIMQEQKNAILKKIRTLANCRTEEQYKREENVLAIYIYNLTGKIL